MTHTQTRFAIAICVVGAMMTQGYNSPAVTKALEAPAASQKIPALIAQPSAEAVDLQAGIAVTHAPKNYGRLSWSNSNELATDFQWARLDVPGLYIDRRSILDRRAPYVPLDITYDRKEGAWSPDSKRFVFSMKNESLGVNTLRVIAVETYYNVDSRHKELVANNLPLRGRDPSWTPDGRYLIFVDKDGDIGKVDMTAVLSDTATPQPETIYDSQTSVRFPRVSPDGTRIAFAEAKAANTPDNHILRVVDIDGTNAVDLTTDTARDDSQPAWSPDATRIVFSRWDPRCIVTSTLPSARYDLYSIPAGGGTETRLSYVAAQDQSNECNHSAEDAFWSPDGTELFFATTNPDNTVFVPPGTGSFALKFQVYRMQPIQRGLVKDIETVTIAARRPASQHFPQIRPVVVTGRTMTYTVVGRNRSAGPASGVTLKGTIPDDTAYISHNAPPGWNCQASTQKPVSVTCNGSTLAAGAIISFPIHVTVLSTTVLGHIITGTADISTSSGDSDNSNNQAEVVRQVLTPEPRLETKLGTIAGNCPLTTTNIVVTYRTPVTYCYTPDAFRNATLIYDRGSNDRYDAGNALIEQRFWRPDEPFKIMYPYSPLRLIQVNSEEPPEERRHHSAWKGEIFDAFGVVSATAHMTEIVLYNADVRIDITTTSRIVKPRELVTFTITVTNEGPDDPVVSVIDLLPGFTNIKAVTTRPNILGPLTNACAPATTGQISCKLGTMIAATNAVMTVTANAPALNGIQVNTASVAGNGLQDTVPDDNTAFATIIVDGPGIQTFLPLMRRQ